MSFFGSISSGIKSVVSTITVPLKTVFKGGALTTAVEYLDTDIIKAADKAARWCAHQKMVYKTVEKAQGLSFNLALPGVGVLTKLLRLEGKKDTYVAKFGDSFEDEWNKIHKGKVPLDPGEKQKWVKTFESALDLRLKKLDETLSRFGEKVERVPDEREECLSLNSRRKGEQKGETVRAVHVLRLMHLHKFDLEDAIREIQKRDSNLAVWVDRQPFKLSVAIEKKWPVCPVCKRLKEEENQLADELEAAKARGLSEEEVQVLVAERLEEQAERLRKEFGRPRNAWEFLIPSEEAQESMKKLYGQGRAKAKSSMDKAVAHWDQNYKADFDTILDGVPTLRENIQNDLSERRSKNQEEAERLRENAKVLRGSPEARRLVLGQQEPTLAPVFSTIPKPTTITGWFFQRVVGGVKR